MREIIEKYLKELEKKEYGLQFYDKDSFLDKTCIESELSYLKKIIDELVNMSYNEKLYDMILEHRNSLAIQKLYRAENVDNMTYSQSTELDSDITSLVTTTRNLISLRENVSDIFLSKLDESKYKSLREEKYIVEIVISDLLELPKLNDIFENYTFDVKENKEYYFVTIFDKNNIRIYLKRLPKLLSTQNTKTKFSDFLKHLNKLFVLEHTTFRLSSQYINSHYYENYK